MNISEERKKKISEEWTWKFRPEKFISRDDIEKLIRVAKEARALLIVYAEKFRTNTFDEWLKRLDEALEPFEEK